MVYGDTLVMTFTIETSVPFVPNTKLAAPGVNFVSMVTPLAIQLYEFTSQEVIF